MNDTSNIAFEVSGGQSEIGQLAIGPRAKIINNSSRPARRRKGIGVVTIKAAESRAVADVFGLTGRRDDVTGQRFYLGEVDAEDGRVPLVAVRTLEQGQRSTMKTLENLRSAWNPAVLVIVGVGGAIYHKLRLGDVVIADRVFYYDLRREAADGTHHRGEGRPVPAAISHAMNAFFDDHGEVPDLPSPSGRFEVMSGPIGSGDAVITDDQSQIRAYLRTVNEKVLAVDTESGALTQFCHECTPPQPDWLVVRGISDHANQEKTEEHQPQAARNAAITLQHLIPYLRAAA